MTQNKTFIAIIFALALCSAGTAAVLLPMPVALLPTALSLGAAGGCLILLLSGSGDIEAGPPAEPAGPRRADARELLEAFDEPTLLVAQRRVMLANASARALLGEHIEGDDVRLAIRHPAAAERLVDQTGESPESATRTDLAGLGEAEQRWEMAVATLPGGSRLVRLLDRSRDHAVEQARADFVANASHELRTPLAALLGFLETLEDEEVAADAPTRRKFLTIMTEESERMRALVDDLMSLSRVEADRFTTPREPVDLPALIDDVDHALARIIAERGSTLIVENRASEAVVSGDRVQLAQLLTNLVTNALRYGRTGTPVRVRLDNAGTQLIRLSVIDQGDGIAAEHLPRLTERFYRVDASRSRSVGGTGLGLAIVKHIALRHRGRLDIRSTLGEGTTVRVYLPRHRFAA